MLLLPTMFLPLLRRLLYRGALLSLAVTGLGAGIASATPLVRFEWSSAPVVVSPGATEVFVDLIARQDDGANAGYFTLGFGRSGIITNLELEAFGAQVSDSDSFFGSSSGTLTMIASAPANPGSFGTDVDVTVATLRLVLDTALGGAGALSLLDLTATAGAPALEENGTTAIPSEFAAPLSVTVIPEPNTGLLVLAGCLALAARARRGPA